MPYQFVIDKAAKVVRETWTGVVTVADLKESSRAEWAHPDFQKDLNMISDFRRGSVEISTEEMWGLVSWFGQSEWVGKHALVVSREVGFGLARMFSTISEGQKHYSDSLQVFYSYEDAEKWLADSAVASKG
ncbi:MAG TPA: hypothetical protein VK629_08815 [Steroidobacteraceae bacterium]|nr:hypothetical protein [Steroidobacteraceae bacterium]